MAEGMEYITDQIRCDNHAPYGEHLNYEVQLDLGDRRPILSNTHIPIDVNVDSY